MGGDHQPADDQHQVEHQQDAAPEQPVLFGKDGKDEVGMALRDEFQMGLSALQPALAEGAAGTDGDGRLNDVITGPKGVRGGVDQCQDASPLVVVQDGPDEGRGGRPGNDHADDDLPRQAGKEDDVEPGGTDQNRRAQVGLLGDQAEGNNQQQSGDQVMTQLERCFVLVEVPGQHQRHGHLEDFGRLDTHQAKQRQPAPRPINLDAHEIDQNQQDDTTHVERDGKAHQLLRRELRN